MMRANRGVSPIPTHRFNRVKRHLAPGEMVEIRQRNEVAPEEFFVNPLGPNNRQNNHPYLRNIGLVGLGAGLGIVGYHYHKPLMKLGQKVINYGLDKFHHLFPSNNSTSTQIGNREGF